MTGLIAAACIALALFLDACSYWKQTTKILRTRNSAQVSSSAYVYRIWKAVLSIFGLALYANWAGVVMNIFMLLVYIASLYVIAKYKPKNWRLF